MTGKGLTQAGAPRRALENPSVSVQRALALLEAVAESSDGMSNAEISRKLKIPKSSASYILRALANSGYLRRDPQTHRYRIGMAIVGLSHRALSALDIREVARPILEQLVQECRMTAHLAVPDQDKAVYVLKVEAPGFVKMDTWVGRRMDLHSTSVGKAILAFQPEERWEAVLGSASLGPHTPRTITSPERLRRDLERVRHRGYATDDEENSPGVRCVGAPVFNREGRVEASIGVSGITRQLDRHSMAKVADMVKAAAARLSQQLGYRP